MIAIRKFTAALALAVGMMSSAPLAWAETAPAVIRIAFPGTIGPNGQAQSASGQNRAAAEELEKEFAGSGTKIEWQYFVNVGPGINEAFASKQIDFASYGDFPAVIARSNGIPIKLVLPFTRGALESYLVVPVDSPAKNVGDLKGKRVAINQGRPWTLAFSRLLDSQGLKFGDFQIFNMVMPDGDAAVAAKTVDGQVTLDGLLLQSKGLGKIIWSTLDSPADWKFSADVFAHEAFTEKYPETTKRVVRAFLRASYYNMEPKNRDQFLKELAASQQIPVELLGDEWKKKDIRVVLSPEFDAGLKQHYQNVIDFAFDNKLIRRKPALGELLEPSYFEALRPELTAKP